MAIFIYRSTLHGPREFTVSDEGGIVEMDGKPLAADGGYLGGVRGRIPLKADACSLEACARRWWKARTGRLAIYGHKANGVEP